MSFFFGQRFFYRIAIPDTSRLADLETGTPLNEPPYDIIDLWYSSLIPDGLEKSDDQEVLLEHLAGEHSITAG